LSEYEVKNQMISNI